MARGQLFTTDYVIGVAVFILMLASCLFVWQKTAYRIQEDFAFNGMMNTAKRASEQLVTSSGIPADWEDNAGSVRAVGLAAGDRIISPKKFAKLAAMDYNTSKYYLGVGNHDFYIKLMNSTGSLYGEAGRTPTGDFAVNVRRILVMDNRTIILDLTIWGSELSPVVLPTQ